MSSHLLINYISTFFLLFPFIILLAFKLFKYQKFQSLFLYFIVLALFHFLTVGVFNAPVNFIKNVGLFFNFIDAPLILFFLTYFATPSSLIRRINQTIYSVIAFEIIILFTIGFNIDSAAIILGPGILAVVVYSFIIFQKTIGTTVIHLKGSGKTLVTTAVLFAYSIYALLYVFFYILKTPHQADTYLIYNLTSIISSILMTWGLYVEGKRLKNLVEAKRTRKELSEFFNEEKAVNHNKLTAFL